MNILAIESSCDDTGVAVVKDGREVLSSGREVLRAPLVRQGGRSPWSAVTAKSKALCFTAAHCEKMLRFL